MTSDLGQRIGGKAANLAHLQRIGCSVPAWFAIEAKEFATAIEHPDIRHAIDEATTLVAQDRLDEAARVVREAMLQRPIPDRLRTAIVERWSTELAGDVVAVRSSAIGEDGVEHSFAGQFESVLGIETEQQLLDAIRQCWASAWTERAVAYRARHGMPPLEAEMALVVQRLVDAEVAGVLFTGDPISGDPLTSVVSATFGLGEALVSGAANADTYRVDRRHGAVAADIADKDIMVVRAAEGLVEQIDVPSERRESPALTDAQVLELVVLGERVENAAGGLAQDIEWAVVDGTLHVLQTRPVTTPLHPRGIRRAWDDSNIVESALGVVSPLTFSFLREACWSVSRQALRLARFPDSELDHACIVVRPMLCYVDGRVCWNLASWRYLLSAMPGHERHAAAMEHAMGNRAPLDPRVTPRRNASRTVRLHAAMRWRLLRIHRSVREFRANVRDVLARHDVNFATLDADQLVNAWDDMRAELLEHWQTPIVVDMRAVIAFDRLRSAIRALGFDDDGTLQNDLLRESPERQRPEGRIAARRSMLMPIRRLWFAFVLRQARSAVRDREAMGSERNRVFGLARRIFAALGDRLHEAGLIDASKDVFCLEVDEIVGAVQATTTISDLRGLVALRRDQHERWEQVELPDRFKATHDGRAREFGIPGIVGIPGLMSWDENGEAMCVGSARA